MSRHMANKGADRALGEWWEGQFCQIAKGRGWFFYRMQRQNESPMFRGPCDPWPTPDVLLMQAGVSQWHEVRHKNPTRDGRFGYERHRFEGLLGTLVASGIPTFLTFHDHDRAGGRDSKLNRPEHWVTARVDELARGPYEARRCKSYGVGGGFVPVFFFDKRLFKPLDNALWVARGVA